ncbi:MAG: transposase [Nitrococcus mobilis]|nr:transposase [Nitrococcus mobilis]
MSERRARIHTEHALVKTRRCALLNVPRSSAYYRPAPASARDLALMRAIDEIHLRWPFYGSRRLRDEIQGQGHGVNRKRVQRLMRQMGLRALYPRRRTSRPGKAHKIYPYCCGSYPSSGRTRSGRATSAIARPASGGSWRLLPGPEHVWNASGGSRREI